MRRLTTLTLVLSLLSTGCGTMGIRYLGIRPDAPDIVPSKSISDWCEIETGVSPPKGETFAGCVRFYQTVEWADQLVESYRSRATMNEWSIYAAGTIALGALAAVGGLAVAGAAASETAGLVSVSSGFASGFFAFLDNKTRAGFYTEAANDIATARAEALSAVAKSHESKTYWSAAGLLSEAITRKVNWLETQRSEAAAKADTAKQLADMKKQNEQLSNALLSGSVDQLNPLGGKEGDSVSLITSGLDLQAYKDRLKVTVGATDVKITLVESRSLMFTVPKQPDTTKATYPVQLRLGNIPIGPKPLDFTYK